MATKPNLLQQLQQQRLGAEVTVKAVGPLEEGLRIVTVKRGDVETKTAYKPGEKPRVISVGGVGGGRAPPGGPPAPPPSEPTPEPTPLVKAAITGAEAGAEVAVTGPPPKTRFTLPEYQREVFGRYERASRSISEAEAYKASLRPGGKIWESVEPGMKYKYTYPLGHPRAGETAILTSADVKQELYEESRRIRTGPAATAEASIHAGKLWKHYQETTKWHPETKIEFKEGQYEFIFPDPSLEWSKGELKKIDIAYKLHPLVGAAAEFGFFATSSFAALGKPVAQLFTDKPLPHYLSPLDIAFEPLGWSPKGSAKLIGERPIGMAGGIWGETLQLASFHYGVKGITAGIKIGTKGVVKYIPKAVGKIKTITGVSRPVFESQAKLLEGGFKVVGKPQTVLTKTFGVTTKVGETQFWKNIYGWSTGKLIKVKTLPMVSRTFLGESRTGVQEGPYTVFGKVTKYRGLGKTEWVYPKVAEQYQIGKHISHIHKVTTTTPGVGERIQIFSSEIIGKPKGHLWWKRATTQYASIKEMERLGVRFKPIGGAVSEYGGWVRPGYEVAVAKITDPFKSGAKFWLSEEAQMSLVRPVTMYRPMMTGGIHGAKMIGETIHIPTTAFSYAPLTIAASGMTLASASALRYGLLQESILERRELTIPKFDVARVSLSLTKQAQAYALDTESILAQSQDTEQRLLQAQTQLQVQAQLQAYKLKTVQVTIPKHIRMPKPVPPPYRYVPSHVKPFIFPPFLEEGKRVRRKQLPYVPWGKGYRIRKWKVPKMEQFLKGVM